MTIFYKLGYCIISTFFGFVIGYIATKSIPASLGIIATIVIYLFLETELTR